MAYRSASMRTNILGRNNENIGVVRPGKEVAKMVSGPTLRRAVLGEIKTNVLQRSTSTTVGGKPIAVKPALGFRKPVVSKAKPKEVKKTLATRVEQETVSVDTSMTSLCMPASRVEDMSVVITEEIAATPVPPQPRVEEQPSPDVTEDPEILELSDAFSSKLLTVTDIDAEDKDNPQLVSEYVNDIYAYMKGLENKLLVPRRYLEGRVVTPRMRTILVDWLVQVHSRFNMMQESLYLTIAVLDRYLHLVPDTPKDQLQLVGVTAMFVAGKYEEMYCSEIGDFVYITDKAFSKLQIRQMEIKILRALGYYISYPLPLHFLRRNSKAAQVDGMQHTLAKYLMELCLPDYNMCHYKASQIAAAALCLTMKLIGEDGEWTDTVAHYSGYAESDILPIVCKMAQCVTRSHSSKQQSIPQKYRSTKHMKVSELDQLRGGLIRNLSEKAVSST